MLVEVCAGSVEDCVIAQENGANRIELNSGLSVGGLTPSFATFLMAKRSVELPIICMVRPRGGGFCYSEQEQAVMLQDAYLFLENGAAGIAFGFLNEDGTIDRPATESMIELCHSFGKEAVFHRAIDCSSDLFEAVNVVAGLGCNRILTSGGKSNAMEASQQLTGLIDFFGSEIEFCLASGIKADNIEALAKETNAQQFHGSFSHHLQDPTGCSEWVDFSIDKRGDIQQTNPNELRIVVETVRDLSK